MTQIQPSRDLLTLINIFTVSPRRSGQARYSTNRIDRANHASSAGICNRQYPQKP